MIYHVKNVRSLKTRGLKWIRSQENLAKDYQLAQLGLVLTSQHSETIILVVAWSTLLLFRVTSQKKAQFSPLKHSSPPTEAANLRNSACDTASKFFTWKQRSIAIIQQSWAEELPAPSQQKNSPVSAAISIYQRTSHSLFCGQTCLQPEGKIGSLLPAFPLYYPYIYTQKIRTQKEYSDKVKCKSCPTSFSFKSLFWFHLFLLPPFTIISAESLVWRHSLSQKSPSKTPGTSYLASIPPNSRQEFEAPTPFSGDLKNLLF